MVDADHDGPLEAALPCPAEIQPNERIWIRTEPSHDEAYTTITKSQWDYPAILAAYDAVACSPEVATRPGSRLSCREVYRAEPDDIGPDDTVCDGAFPLGDPRGMPPRSSSRDLVATAAPSAESAGLPADLPSVPEPSFYATSR